MLYYAHGALAQLGAHNTGSVGVRGSSPLCSTRKNLAIGEVFSTKFGFAESNADALLTA